MADNVDITAGIGTTVATDNISSVHHPYVKVEFGADNTATPVSTTNPLPISSANDTGVGSLTETAPGTDTASSGLNGRLQRIAQRLTSLIALIPTALGQGTMATSFKVVLPSDQTSIPRKKTDAYAAATAFTITLASLANSTAGVGRQSTLVTSNTSESAIISVKFTAGTSPTANSLIYVYLIRGDGSINDDAAGASDAGLTIVNAPLLGTILCSAATSNATYYGVFDTKFLGSLGPTFGIAVVNSTGATANATGGNFAANYTLIT